MTKINSIITSIIIVNYNGKEYVDKSVASIVESGTEALEIIVVDNGSQDGSVEFLETKYKDYKPSFGVVSLDKNYGPAYARNEGAKIAKGKYLGFLDNDTRVHKDWAKIAVNEFEKDEKLGVIQCKLLLSKERNKIDYVGEYIGQNGFLIQRSAAAEIDSGQYDQKVYILAAKSAGMFIRKEAFEKIGGFDADYFIYVEETDLGWRCWLAGYTIMFIPASIVYHEFGTSTVILGKAINNYNAKFHGSKNYILTLYKNLGFGSLLKILPVHIFLWIGLAGFALSKGDIKACGWIFKGIAWNVVYSGKNLKKRRDIQDQRKISDKELFKIIMKKKPFYYFLSKAVKPQKVGNAEGFIKTK